MEKIILHIDLNNFFASVEQLINPYLKTKPMAVAGNPKNRHGIVLAKNMLAKEKGVKTAETIYSARQKCPGIIFVPPKYDLYERYAHIVRNIYYDYTDKVEFFGIDEAWLDVTGSVRIYGSGVDIANLIRNRIKKETGLTVSVGVSFNKIFAKLGSDLRKPDYTTVINKENYKKKIYPLYASNLLYVGKKMYERLKDLGIYTIGDIAKADKKFIVEKFGAQGEKIWNAAKGIADDFVMDFHDNYRLVSSIGKGKTFDKDLSQLKDIKKQISILSDQVVKNLRSKNLLAKSIKIDVKSFDFKTKTRQKKLIEPSSSYITIRDEFNKLFTNNFSNFRIRALTLTVTNLIYSHQLYQQSFIFNKNNHYLKVDNTIDKIRKRFGDEAISIGFSRLKKKD